MGKVSKAKNVCLLENWNSWNCTHAHISLERGMSTKCGYVIKNCFPRKEISILKLSNGSVYRFQVEAKSITKDSTILSEK